MGTEKMMGKLLPQIALKDLFIEPIWLYKLLFYLWNWGAYVTEREA